MLRPSWLRSIFLTTLIMFKTVTLMNSAPTSSTALTILAHVILPLCQYGPNVIITMGHRALSCAIWCATGPYQNLLTKYSRNSPSRVFFFSDQLILRLHNCNCFSYKSMKPRKQLHGKNFSDCLSISQTLSANLLISFCVKTQFANAYFAKTRFGYQIAKYILPLKFFTLREFSTVSQSSSLC